MNDLATETISTTHPMVRSALYRLLASAIQHPTPEHFVHYQSGDYLSELWDTLSLIPHLERLMREQSPEKQRVQHGLTEANLEDFQSGYTETFDVGTPEPPCPPYEGVYLRSVERSGHLIRLADFYQHFGLKMDQTEGKRELVDHLRVELEFMHFLTFKEAQAREEQKADLLAGYVLAQRDFIQHHLVGWLPVLQKRLEAHCPLPFYVWLGGMLTRIIRLELDYLNDSLE